MSEKQLELTSYRLSYLSDETIEPLLAEAAIKHLEKSIEETCKRLMSTGACCISTSVNSNGEFKQGVIDWNYKGVEGS